jgi:hypothetical protein
MGILFLAEVNFSKCKDKSIGAKIIGSAVGYHSKSIQIVGFVQKTLTSSSLHANGLSYF